MKTHSLLEEGGEYPDVGDELAGPRSSIMVGVTDIDTLVMVDRRKYVVGSGS